MGAPLSFFVPPEHKIYKSVVCDSFYFFLLQAKTKVLCKAAMEARAKSSLWNPCSRGKGSRGSAQPLQSKDHRDSRGSCSSFEMVWGFLLCQTSHREGNWRCVVETSIGAQEMTSLQELVITVRKFALDFYFQVLLGMTQSLNQVSVLGPALHPGSSDSIFSSLI